MPCWRETDNMTGRIQGIQGRYIVVCCVLEVSLQGGGISSGYKFAAELDARGITRRRGDLRVAGPRLPEPSSDASP